jgi:hypothetical protein
MHWRVMVELSGADGSAQTHALHVGSCIPAACSAEILGLTQAQAKQLLAELQRHLVQAQAGEYCRSRHRCPRCGVQRPLKDRRPRQLRSLFGVVVVHAPVLPLAAAVWATARPSRPLAREVPAQFHHGRQFSAGLIGATNCLGFRFIDDE